MTEEMKEEVKTETVFSSYTDAQKRATEKYRQENRDKINEQRKKYYQTRKETDPEFLKYKREKAREYYLKKKANKTEDSEEPKLVEEIVAVELPIEELTEALDSLTMNPIFTETKETETTIDIVQATTEDPKKKRSPGILLKNKKKKTDEEKAKEEIKEEIKVMESIIGDVQKELFETLKEPTPISPKPSVPIHCVSKPKKKSSGKK